MVERGGVTTLPEVTNWASTNKSPTAQRRAFYEGPPAAFAFPGVSVELDTQRRAARARGAADSIGRYPGAQVTGLPSVMCPCVRLEVGRARIVPFARMPLTSFVHKHLARLGVHQAPPA